jgi:hypothetical protein
LSRDGDPLEFSVATAPLEAPDGTFTQTLSRHCGPTVNVHQFAEVINGREYQIEVSPVGTGRWRAQIRRLPGGSAALMPFYGRTPDEAAAQLSRWLLLANGQPAVSRL